jgi:hypothetical protein
MRLISWCNLCIGEPVEKFPAITRSAAVLKNNLCGITVACKTMSFIAVGSTIFKDMCYRSCIIAKLISVSISACVTAGSEFSITGSFTAFNSDRSYSACIGFGV